MPRACCTLLCCLLDIFCAQAKEPAPSASREFAPWVEPDYPFHSSVLDARRLSEAFPADNLVPRGLILNLGHRLWACFDPDLVRLACLWRGDGVSPTAMAPGTYHHFGWKTQPGQMDLPAPLVSQAWQATGLYPQWQALRQVDDLPDFRDPRPPAPSVEEAGRGPVDPALARFQRLEITDDGIVMHYVAAGVGITEWLRADRNGQIVVRQFVVAPSSQPLALATGRLGEAITRRVVVPGKAPPVIAKDTHMLLPPATAPRTFALVYATELDAAGSVEILPLPVPAGLRWQDTPATHGVLSSSDDAFVTDPIPLPLANPWQRDVRLADIGFLNEEGEAAAVTFDGDVWIISGLRSDLGNIRWKRFTSGLHEPMSLVVRDGVIHVFDRNGIWKILDTDGNGEADTHELFCNLFAQTAETREFPNSMKLAPDGAFIIAKGGQQGATLGKHNGSVLRVAPDGRSIQRLGHGFRQPFLGVHPETGLITASDQQGEYVPSTPLHIVRGDQFYGHLATIQPREQYPEPIADPLTWIPHPVNPSALSQVWLTGASMGPLTGECLHLGYHRPEIFRVLINNRFAKTQAAVVPLSRDFRFAPLNGAVNPADGQLYLAGFQSWGTTAEDISGLHRYRYTGQPRVLLKELTPMDKGVLLRFNEALDPVLGADPARYALERWNYQRTYKYGSPHLKLDGRPGQEWLSPSSAYLSADKKSVFVGVPDMRPVMQLRVGWSLRSADGLPAENNAYTTPHELAAFDPVQEGFGKIDVDLTPRRAVAVPEDKPTREAGQRLAELFGCLACHSLDGSGDGKVGPSWKGLYGSERLLQDGQTQVTADDAYLHESIVNPSAKVVKGFEKFDAGMPIYAGILSEAQIQSLILYIKSL